MELINPLEIKENDHYNKLTDLVKTVTHIEVMDFLTRFTCIKFDQNICNELPWGKHSTNANSYLIRRSKDQESKFVGVLQDNQIVHNNEIIAKYYGTIDTYHYFNEPSMFAGVLGELILQLPSCLKNSDRPYYFSIGQIGFRFNYHYVNTPL